MLEKKKRDGVRKRDITCSAARSTQQQHAATDLLSRLWLMYVLSGPFRGVALPGP